MRIVHASISENGNAGWDGRAKAGDQTGREVFVRDWYSKPWDIMLRYKDKEISKKASEIAVKLANSNLVGYDQSERNTLYKALKRYGWNVDAYIKSGEKTETDCSAFIYAVYCCVVPSMRTDDNAPVTYTMRNLYKQWGFTCYQAAKYVTTPSNLRAGDILVNESSHTVMAIDGNGDVTISTPSEKTATSYAEKFDRAIAGTYKTTADLYIRSGAGTNHKSLGILPKGTQVMNYGYYSYCGNRKWYYIQTTVNGCKYTGFSSSAYLAKV